MLLLFNLPSKGQNVFDWNDTTFEIGSARVLKLYFDFDGNCSTKPCYNYQDNAVEYDNLIHFLAKNSELKIAIKYVFHKDTRVSDIIYYQRVSERRTKGLKYELVKLNALNRQIEFEEFEFSDTLSAISGYKITIIKNKLPNHIKTTISDTMVNHFYNQQFDYFKLKPDTTENKALNNLGFHLEKLLKNDTSLVIEINNQDDVGLSRYSIRLPNISEKTIQYLINNFDIKRNQIISKPCFFKHYYIIDKDKNRTVLVKIKLLSESKKCYQSLLKKIDKCENCPF